MRMRRSQKSQRSRKIWNWTRSCSVSAGTRTTTTRSYRAWTASTQVSGGPSVTDVWFYGTVEELPLFWYPQYTQHACWSHNHWNWCWGCYPGCRRWHSRVLYTCAAGVVSICCGPVAARQPNYVLKTPPLSFGSPAATPHIPTPHRPFYHHHWGSVEKFAKLKATIRRKPILRHTKSKKQSSDRRCMWAAKGGGVAAYDSQ